MKTKTIFILVSILVFGLNVSAMAGDDNRVRLECKAEGITDISMDARFESRDGRTKFDASFEAAPDVDGFGVGSMLAVSVLGVTVDTMMLTLDPASGDLVGDVSYDSNPLENEPFPGSFVLLLPLGAGDPVVVGTLPCFLAD